MTIYPPLQKIINNLKAVCQNILEEARANFGRTVIVHSGYRSPAVNRAVGGSLKSEHVLGQAVDFHVIGYSVYEVAIWVKDNLKFNQLILENFVPNSKNSGWVHCSYSQVLNKKQSLTKFKGSSIYHDGIIPFFSKIQYLKLKWWIFPPFFMILIFKK